MSDKDREAFESAYLGDNPSAIDMRAIERSGKGYMLMQTYQAWQWWQAARDYYTSNLTEKEAATVFLKGYDSREIWDEWDGMDADKHTEILRKAIDAGIKALRAAGVQFKEE